MFVSVSDVLANEIDTYIIHSYRKNENYKRTVIACFIQAVYLLELDRQENRTQENALAPMWWLRFKYKLTQKLIDERDGSIFGAVLEWDRSAAFADMILIRPSGAPKAVLALRFECLKSGVDNPLRPKLVDPIILLDLII